MSQDKIESYLNLTDMILGVNNLRNRATDVTYDDGANPATVTADLVLIPADGDVEGATAITGSAVTLTFVAGSTGRFEGKLDKDTVSVTLGDRLAARIDVDGGALQRRRFTLRCRVRRG